MQDTVLKVLVGLIALFMAINGLGFWFALDTINPVYALSTTADLGRASIRADFGGFFLAVAAMAGYGLLNRSATAGAGAAVLFIPGLGGRVLTVLLDGGLPAGGGLPMMVEATSAAILLWARNAWSST